MLLIFPDMKKQVTLERAANYNTERNSQTVPHSMNATMEKFGYPDTLNPAKPTAGHQYRWKFAWRDVIA